MEDKIETFLKIITVLAAIITHNIYLGAVVIAFISAFTRTTYESECATHINCLFKLFRYFGMALGIAMLFVHIALWANLDTNLTIIVTSYFTFLSEETLRFCINSSSKVVPILTKRFFNFTISKECDH